MSSAPSVVVIGAGVAGLTLRRALHTQGIACEVFERDETLSTKGAGLTLWPNATSVLSRLGCLDEIEARGAPLSAGHLRTPEGKTLARINLHGLIQRTGCPVLGVRRSDLLQVLRGEDRSPIHFAKRLVGIEHCSGGAVARFEDGTEARGTVIAGADGINSMTRELTGAQPKRYSGYIGVQGIAALKTNSLTRGVANWLLGPGSQFGVIPASPGHVYFFGTLNVPEGELRHGAAAAELLHDRFADWGGPVSLVLNSIGESDLVTTPIYDRPPTKTWTSGSVTALGDATHGMAPTFGQGACLAIETAEVLANSLAERASVTDALQHYEQQRIKRTRPLVWSSRLCGRMLQIESPNATAIRNVALRWMPDSVHLAALNQIIRPGLRSR